MDQFASPATDIDDRDPILGLIRDQTVVNMVLEDYLIEMPPNASQNARITEDGIQPL